MTQTTTIVSNKIKKAIENHNLSSRIPDETRLMTWSEFSQNSLLDDHLVLDLDLTAYVDGAGPDDIPLNTPFEGERDFKRINNNAESFHEIFDSFAYEDTIVRYLKSGNSLTILYSDTLLIRCDDLRGTNTHYWLRQLGLLNKTWPLAFRTAFQSDKLISESQPIVDYFVYVDKYTYILKFDDMIDDNPEILAKSAEDNIIAAELYNFKDQSDEVHETDGHITLLPQPTTLQPKPQDLVSALVEIGRKKGSEAAGEIPVSGTVGRMDSSGLDALTTAEIEKRLQNSQYGAEVIDHIRDGDACLDSGIYQPALGSYIHAIEWAFIAYLESEAGVDIIQKEQQGIRYNFAGGQHNLLSEVKNHVTLDQKTESAIKSMNQGERRWMAHHKSGKTLPSEVETVRSRLEIILDELFA